MAQSGQPENVRTAVAEFTKLSVERPKDATHQYNLGTALQRSGELEQARVAFRNAISMRPDYTAPRALLAEIGLYQQNPQETIRYAREILELQPDLDRAKLLLAMGLMHAGQLAEARLTLRSVRQPESYVAKLQLGMIRLAEGDYKEAHTIFQQLYRPGSNDLAPVIGLTSTYVRQKQFDRALSFLEGALPGSANPSGIRYLIAATALASKRYDVAAREYENLIAVQPASVDLLLSLAEARYLAGNREAAVNALTRAKALSPQDPKALARMAYAYEQVGDPEQAIAAYRSALAIAPNRMEALNNLALLLADYGNNREEAEALARRVLEQSKNRPEMRDTLAWVRFRTAGWQSTLPVFVDLAKTYPDNSVYRYHLGAALLQKGERQKAGDELQAALNAHPDSLTATNVRRLLQSLGR